MQLNDNVIDIFLIISFLSFLPAVLVMFTSFTRIVVVLSFLRQAIGAQQVPPNAVLIGLAVFLTFFVMSPVVDKVNNEAIGPYLDKKITIKQAFAVAEPPLKTFMLKQTRQKDIALFLGIAKTPAPATAMELPLRIVVPAFAISELKTAFEIGFLIYLPFLIIDVVVSSVLLSMGMMMLPPVLISLPFKLLLFVLADGWHLVAGSLMAGVT